MQTMSGTGTKNMGNKTMWISGWCIQKQLQLKKQSQISAQMSAPAFTTLRFSGECRSWSVFWTTAQVNIASYCIFRKVCSLSRLYFHIRLYFHEPKATANLQLIMCFVCLFIIAYSVHVLLSQHAYAMLALCMQIYIDPGTCDQGLIPVRFFCLGGKRVKKRSKTGSCIIIVAIS